MYILLIRVYSCTQVDFCTRSWHDRLYHRWLVYTDELFLIDFNFQIKESVWSVCKGLQFSVYVDFRWYKPPCIILIKTVTSFKITWYDKILQNIIVTIITCLQSLLDLQKVVWHYISEFHYDVSILLLIRCRWS